MRKNQSKFKNTEYIQSLVNNCIKFKNVKFIQTINEYAYK